MYNMDQKSSEITLKKYKTLVSMRCYFEKPSIRYFMNNDFFL